MKQLASTHLFGWMGGYGVRNVSALKAICLSKNHKRSGKTKKQLLVADKTPHCLKADEDSYKNVKICQAV
jgi:hypothetical protein